MTSTTTRLFVLCGLASGSALAQPGPTNPQPPTDTIVQPPPEPPPPAQPPQPPQPPVVTVAPAKPDPAPEATRPDGFAIGIGVGYRFPTSLQQPNTTSVRFRLASGLTFEPTLVLASSTQTVDVGNSISSSNTEVGVGAIARFPLVSRRRADLELLGGISLDRLNRDPSDQNTDDNTTTTAIGVSYGVAVGFWLSQHLQVSLSATNTLVTYAHVREEMGIDFVQVTNTTTFGLVFDPTVAAMIHLYN